MTESATPEGDDRLRATVAQLGARSPHATIRAARRATETSPLPRLEIERHPTEDDAQPDDRPEVVRQGALLGSGGMGEVYAGVQRSLGRNVALKFVTEDEGDVDPAAREALLREARITGRLEHPNIVPVHVLGVESGGSPVMVMKRIEGVSWRALLRDRDHEQWRRWSTQHRDALEAHVSVLLSVCDALEYAHKKRVIHRDIKPDNVMIGPFGEVYLLDWGIALELDARGEARSVVGTPSFMAPEMIDGDPSAVRECTDVFLLGATLHYALTGRARHEGDSLHAVLLAARECAPITYGDEVPDELARLCNDATARSIEERIPSVALFRERLAGFVRRRPSHALAIDAEQTLSRAEAMAPSDERGRELKWRTLSDAKLGFTRALAQWPSNTRAIEGLDRARLAMIRHALASEHASAARALYDERPTADPTLDAAIAALEAKEAKDRARAERWAQVEGELDTSHSTKERSLALAVVGALFVAFTVAVVVLAPDGRQPTLVEKLGIELVVAIVAVGVSFWQRDRLLSARGSRRITFAIGATPVVLCLSTLASMRLGASTHAATVLSMSLLSVAYATLSAFSVRAWPATGAALLAATLGAAMPSRMNVIMLFAAAAIAITTFSAAARGRLYRERSAAPDRR
ncbi:MAG: serine/threonine protein kinase [Myxococcales bacterium]|nr:serine/threonine protein kinase [Myxococcales bacterium]